MSGQTTSYILEDWCIVERKGVYYTPVSPEHNKVKLNGLVYNHPRFEDEKRVTTTTIVSGGEGDILITKSGSKYKLGSVCFEYGKLFSNGKQRITTRFNV